MSLTTIEAQPRAGKGKSYTRKAREAGKVPAVIYGSAVEPQTLELDAHQLDLFLGTAASARLFDIQVGDEKHTVLLKEVQRDPARGTLVHVDFHKVRLDQAIETSVPVVLVGENERAADGGIVALNMHEILVSCLPTAIPDSITVDVKELTVGDTLTVGDLDLGEGIDPVDDPETAVVSVVVPQEEPEAEAADEDAEADAEAEGADESAEAEADAGDEE